MAKIPERRNGIRVNDYKIEGRTVYMTTRNDPSVIIKFDKKHLSKALKYSWSTHPHLNGIKTVCHRYIDDNGKWRSISFSGYIGYGKSYVHKNKDLCDFRSENMITKSEFWKLRKE